MYTAFQEALNYRKNRDNVETLFSVTEPVSMLHSHNKIAEIQIILKMLRESEGELTCLEQATTWILFSSFPQGEIRIIENILYLLAISYQGWLFLKQR